MANVKEAKETLMQKLESLVDSSSFEQNDTILATQALETLEESVDEEVPPNPVPQFHYRSTRPEFSLWSAHYNHCGGAVTVDKYGIPQRQRAYWYHELHCGADGSYYGVYAGGHKEQYAGNNTWFACNGKTPQSNDCYINGTTSNGELGNFRMIQGYRALETCADSTEAPARMAEQPKIGNAELDEADTYMTYDGTTIKHKFRHVSVHDGEPISSKSVTSQGDASYGSLSYNKTRGELVVHNRDTADSNFNFRVSIYKSVTHISRHTDISTMLQESNRTQLLYNMTNGYSSGDSESYANNKIVLCDNGSIYVGTMNPSTTTYYLSLLTRDTGDTTLTYSASPGTISLYASGISGRQQSGNHGQRIIQSRDRKNVMMFCAYAYYANGLISYIIDKTRNQHYTGPAQTWTDQSLTPGPYGNRDFAVCRSQNWDSPWDQSLIVWIQKPDGSWVETDIGNQLDHSGLMSANYPVLIPIQP